MEFRKILHNECWRFVSRRLPFKKNAVTLGKKKTQKPDCGGRNVAEFAPGSWFHVGWCCLVTSVDWAESDSDFQQKMPQENIMCFYTLRIFKVLRFFSVTNSAEMTVEFAVGSEDAMLWVMCRREVVETTCLQKCSWCLRAAFANSNLQNRVYLVNSRYNVNWF